MTHFSRPLYTKELVREFLSEVLNYPIKKNRLISQIVDGELALSQIDIEQNQTLSSPNFRDGKYVKEDERWKLRKKIINDLIRLQRLDSDDKINIQKGGARPLTDLKSEKQAIIIIGLPASGKSSIASKIADKHGAIILDSDFAKRKLPEFSHHIYGASLVHAESSEITFGFSRNDGKLKSLYEICLENGHNILIPKIGQKPSNILELAKILKLHEYDVHLISVELTKREATIRALERFKCTKRYVPLGLVFDEYGNDSHLCYYYLRSKHPDVFKSFCAINNDVQKGEDPICTDIFGVNCPIQDEYKKDNNIMLL